MSSIDRLIDRSITGHDVMSVRTCVATAHHGLGDDWMTMEWGLLRGIRGWAGCWWWLGCLLVAMINYDRHDHDHDHDCSVGGDDCVLVAR